jgi:hypothetical protein
LRWEVERRKGGVLGLKETIGYRITIDELSYKIGAVPVHDVSLKVNFKSGHHLLMA